MQNLLPSAFATLAVFVAGAAVAQPPGSVDFNARATLASTGYLSQEATIHGVNWRCEGVQCRGVAERTANADNIVRECRRVVAVIGPVTSYQNRGRELTAGQLKACNKAAQMHTAQK
jgi:hypothetical protein